MEIGSLVMIGDDAPYRSQQLNPRGVVGGVISKNFDTIWVAWPKPYALKNVYTSQDLIQLK